MAANSTTRVPRVHRTPRPMAAETSARMTASVAPEPATVLAAVDCTLASQEAPEGAPAKASRRALALALEGNSHSAAAPSHRTAHIRRAPRSPSSPRRGSESLVGACRGHTSSPARMYIGAVPMTPVNGSGVELVNSPPSPSPVYQTPSAQPKDTSSAGLTVRGTSSPIPIETSAKTVNRLNTP